VTDSRHALVLKAPRNVRERRQTLAFALNSDGDGIAVVDVERERVRVHRIANVDSLAFEVAEDGTLVVAADNGQLYWSTWETGTLAELGVHGNVKPALALSSDGRWMATSLQANGSVRLWNRSGEYFEYRLQNQVVALLFSLSGRELLAASGASVHSWAVPSDEFLRTAIGQVPQSRPTIPTAALRGYLGTPGFRALRYREATQSWEELPTQHVDDKIAPSVQPMVLASVLASDLESADRRIAAAGRLARLKTADPRVVDTALSGLRAVKHYPAIAQATLGYLSSTAGAAGPVLLSRLETEREGNLLAGLLWGARELQLQSPALLTGARRGLQSSDPDLQLLSATIAGGTESSPEILRALLSWRQSPLVKNDDVWPLVLAYDTKVAVRVIARLGEIDQRDAITFIGQAGPVAVPWLTRLAEERLRTDTHLVILATLKRLSPDVVLPPTALQSNDSNPVYVSSEDFFKKEVEALRKGAGASPCHDFFVPVPAPDDPSDLALFKEAARLLLARTGRLDTEDSVACLWKLRDMGRASGIEPIEFVPLLNRTSQRIDPMRYRINDAILLDLEDAEVPLDVVKALRAAQPIEWDPRETFEKRMTEVLGEQSWQRHRTQILATAGRAVPSFCDEDGPLSLVTSILENYGPAAARAEVPLRALAAKYANCTDVVGDIARALNFIIPP
jgi:hypothetical protein